MPRSAIATGMVDWVLPVARHAGAPGVVHARPAAACKLPPEDGPQPAQPAAAAARRARGGAARGARPTCAPHRARLHLLQAGDDPAPHRPAHAGQRRRRAAGLPRLPAHPSRRGRRAAAGPADQRHQFLPRPRRVRRARGADPGAVRRQGGRATTVRVWVPACATGEEAYSIAMLLAEHARALEAPPALQVFATDLDDDADPRPRARASTRRRSRPTFARSGCAASSSGAARLPGPRASCARWCSSPRTTC